MTISVFMLRPWRGGVDSFLLLYSRQIFHRERDGWLLCFRLLQGELRCFVLLHYGPLHFTGLHSSSLQPVGM